MFLVPLGADRHELYCEAPQAEAEPAGVDEAPGLFARLRRRFSEMVARAEIDRARRASGELPDVPDTWWERLHARMMAWVADAIAEQRLLWQLRRQDRARLNYPSDMPAERAMAIARASLVRDRDRHWFWLVVDSLLMIAAGMLVVVPGPNLIGYYFAFRVVGHYLSWRGARQGLDHVQWETAPCDPLTELRAAIEMAPVEREQQVERIASRLRLEKLRLFVERVAWKGA